MFQGKNDSKAKKQRMLQMVFALSYAAGITAALESYAAYDDGSQGRNLLPLSAFTNSLGLRAKVDKANWLPVPVMPASFTYPSEESFESPPSLVPVPRDETDLLYPVKAPGRDQAAFVSSPTVEVAVEPSGSCAIRPSKADQKSSDDNSATSATLVSVDQADDGVLPVSEIYPEFNTLGQDELYPDTPPKIVVAAATLPQDIVDEKSSTQGSKELAPLRPGVPMPSRPPSLVRTTSKAVEALRETDKSQQNAFEIFPYPNQFTESRPTTGSIRDLTPPQLRTNPEPSLSPDRLNLDLKSQIEKQTETPPNRSYENLPTSEEQPRVREQAPIEFEPTIEDLRNTEDSRSTEDPQHTEDPRSTEYQQTIEDQQITDELSPNDELTPSVQARLKDEMLEEFDFASVAPKSQLRVLRHATESIRFTSSVKQFFVEDVGICRVVLTAQNEISVIGRSVGTTRIAIKADGKNGEEVTIIQVRTAPTWDLPIATSKDDFEQLSITVHEMFPDSKINIVRSKDDAMIVTGIVPDELTAIKIMTFIRRVCLVPIRDMVIVQPNRR